MPKLRQTLPFLFVLAIATLLANDTFAQANRSSVKEQKFATQFWTYLLSNNYKHWSPAPGKTTDHFASQIASASNVRNPHGATMKIYINRIAASNPDSPPMGSVLVLENYRADKSLETISVMYRTKGFNPSANDWYWVNYKPDGTVATEKYLDHANGITTVSGGIQQTYASTRSPKKLMGRTQSCIQCHQSGGNDLAFFNNRQNQTTVAQESNHMTLNSPLINTSPTSVGSTAGNVLLNQNQFSGR